MISTTITTFYFVYIIVMVGILIMVALERRNPVKVIAWVVVMILLPVVGFILYLFFGQDKRRKYHISRQRLNRIHKNAILHRTFKQGAAPTEEIASLSRMLWANAKATLYEENKITLLSSGRQKFDLFCHHLRQAKHHIHLQYYIFENDEIGYTIQRILIDKARQGIEVRLIYDDVGCWKVNKKFYREMKQAGVEISNFLPVTFKMLTSRINYRNHRKVAVIDGRYGYVGGMNIADRYITGNHLGAWRDTHAFMEGAVVHGLQIAFLVDWYFCKRKLVNNPVYFPTPNRCGTAQVQVVMGGPFSEWHELNQALFKAISSAQKTLYVQTPYFMPTESILTALQTAALSGVDVRLMIPARADSWLTSYGSKSYIPDMLHAGVKVYLYREGFLHSKTIVVDDTITIVGSTNLDFRSLEHNFEISTFIYDRETASTAKQLFAADLQKSRRINHKTWNKRQKLVLSIARLLSPLL